MKKVQELLREWQSLQPIKPELQHRMDQSFMIDFNYNSNHLEGNTLTYGQTKLLLLFGKIKGEALVRDIEEMKAHNVGLEMMKIEAQDKERPLSENFIRELNRTILAGDFYKVSYDGSYRYKIHTGIYKTRPNSVITPAGEMFDYASPEETPSLMGDLVCWYNEAEREAALSPVELAALFHYRYIRIHPFEDGNGRIARLIVNYILFRHGYPMIVIPTANRRQYLDALGKCDNIVGKELYKGADATIEQIKSLTEFIALFVKQKLNFALDLLHGKIGDISETDPEQQKEPLRPNDSSVNININVSIKDKIADIIGQFPVVTVKELARLTKASERTVKRHLKELQEKGKIVRIGSDKTGHWQLKY